MTMKRKVGAFAAVATILLVLVPGVRAQIHRYWTPGSVWTVSGIRITAGMDQAYLQYLDGPFKKIQDAAVKGGVMKSYKILRTIDDDASGFNLLILREYPSLAAMEANEEKEDAIARQIAGDDQVQMAGYENRSKVREMMWIKTARELVLK